MLWIWKHISFQRSSQVLRVRKYPHIFPVSGGNVWRGYKAAEHFPLLISDLPISHGLLLFSQHRASPLCHFPRSAWSRCSGFCCRQSRASANRTGVGTTDTPWRKGAEGHRKPLWSISFDIWPDQFERNPFNKMQASTRASTNCFLKNSSSHEALLLQTGMAES